MSDAVSKPEQEKIVHDHTAPPAAETTLAPSTSENGGAVKPMDVDAPQKTQEAPATAAEGESDVTKEGKPAEVGEKRERPDDAAPANGSEEKEAAQAAGEDAGKETKKARTDDAEGDATAAGPSNGAAEPLAEGAAPANGDAAPAEVAEQPAKRGPGRPPKSKGAAAPAATTAEGGEPKKRGPGRPRKVTNPSKEGEEAKGNDAEPTASTGTRRSTRSRA